MSQTASISTFSSRSEVTIALAGNPNVGKTTLFNALTGLKQKVANYPGVTVEKKTGRCNLAPQNSGHKTQDSALIIDLPGTYSLASRSPDEHVARSVLLGQIPGTPRPDLIIVCADATNLERNLYLVTQMLELGRPVIVALTMSDIAQSRGIHIDAEKLARHLRTPVIPVQAHKSLGLEELKAQILKSAHHSVGPLALPLPPIMETHIDRLKKILADENLCPPDQSYFDAHLLLSSAEEDPADTAAIDPRRGNPRIRAELAAALDACAKADVDPIAAEVETHYNFIAAVVHDCLREEKANIPQFSRTDRIDRIVTHRIWGMAIFLAIMALMFWSIFSWAQPLMDFLQNDVIGAAANAIDKSQSFPDGPLKDLVVHGIFVGVGNVVAFLPQIAILFLFLAILEDSGYMARAAFLMDRLMSKVGLHGKSFIPLLSAYACAVPAIMGTRVIENRRDRLATIMVLPLMSCSARLPIYSMLIALCFPGSAFTKAVVMLVMYALGTLSAFAMAWLFKRTLLKGPAPAFILEMPPYRFPKLRSVLTTLAQRSWAFLKRAGTLIFAFSVLMWAATNYPKPVRYSQNYDHQIAALQTQLTTSHQPPTTSESQEISSQIDDLQNAKAQEILDHSIAGRVGHVIAPIFYPLGFDWKTSIAVTGAFFARETVISTLGITYSVGQTDPEETDELRGAMQKDAWPPNSGPRSGTPIWTPLVAISLMVFVVYCMQCLSTLAITRRETGNWRWPILMFSYMTALAWFAAFVVYQGGHLLGWS